MNRRERRQKMKKQKPILRNNVMKLSKKDMITFSERLNEVFGLLNNLTDSKVFESSVFEWNGEDMIHIKVCGRDSVWTESLECIDRGMCGDNDFIKVLKGVESPMTSPMYSHLLPNYDGFVPEESIREKLEEGMDSEELLIRERLEEEMDSEKPLFRQSMDSEEHLIRNHILK